ncbi:MAG: class I SAM-dependent methyltransferase [Pseudomonadota bacterium]
MTGFSTSWLALREPADLRARSSDIADAVQARFFSREHIKVVDLGCGTGSNLRGTAALLPNFQSWTLVDYDAGLLTAARAELSDWAEKSVDDGGVLKLEKGRQRLEVTFEKRDLSKGVGPVLESKPDLVTAAAFFDLVSSDFIRSFVGSVVEARAAFLTVLTYNGISQWAPRHPLDQSIISAFHHHQATDKGFGPASGPTAPAHLADQFKINGYIVSEGDSPWRLNDSHAQLIADLRAGHVAAARDTKLVDADTATKWGALDRTGVVIGHTDTFAVPGG